jgi:hypothetical protein
MLRGNHEARAMNGWVAQYGECSFQSLCLNVEHSAGLMPRELWFEFNAVFDCLPIAAVRFRPQSDVSAQITLTSQVIQGSIFAVHGGLPRRSTWDHLCSGAAAHSRKSTVVEANAKAGAGSVAASPPIELLLHTLPCPWNGENPCDEANRACTAG